MPYISNAFVSEALDCARRGGVDIGAVLAQAKITAPGSGMVTAEEFGALWLAIAEAMNDEFFGNAARPMRPGSFTLMCHAVRDAETVEIGLRRALRFLRVAIDEPYGTLRIRDGIAEIALHDSRRDRSAFAYRTYWVILHGLTCWLARTRIPLQDLALSCAQPKAAADYGDFFGAPVQFSSDRGRLRYDAAYLKRPADRSARDLKRFLRAAPGVFLTRYQHGEGLAQVLARRLQNTPAQDWPSLTECASELGLGVATLRRRLAHSGTSYRALRGDVLRQRALAEIRAGTLSVTEVATLLGYSEPSAFFRAFKGWTGQTPQAWREAKQQKAR